METETIFDKIIAGTIPCSKVYEDENVLAFNDINPQAPIHVLVIPKKKILNVGDADKLTPEEAGLYFQAIGKVAEKLGLSENGYRVVFNNGRDGQQTVDYIHAHILGGRPMNWPPG